MGMEQQLTRLLAALLLLLLRPIAAVAAAQASVPVCSELSLWSRKIQTGLRTTLSPGTKVRVTVLVKNKGLASANVNVRISSPVLAAWKLKVGSGWDTSFRIEGASVYWLNQNLAPGQKRRYAIKARVCAGTKGSTAAIEAAAYRLTNATSVACSSRLTRSMVRANGWCQAM